MISTCTPNAIYTSLNICSVFKRSSKVYSDSPLFILPHTKLSYRNSWSIACAHREWIQSQIQKSVQETGDAVNNDIIVAYLASNSPDLLLSMFGCLDASNFQEEMDERRRITLAMLNTRWTPREIANILKVNIKSSKRRESVATVKKYVTLILYENDLAHRAEESVNIIRSGDHLAIALPLPNFVLSPPSPKMHSTVFEETYRRKNMHSDAILLFTSGTTSGAKGVRLSHLSLFIQAFSKTTGPCYYNNRTTMLATTVPFFHVGGLSSALALIMAGGSFVFPEQQDRVGFDSKIAIQSITDFNSRVNLLLLVPAMLQAIIDKHEECDGGQRNSSPSTFPRVELLLIGGQSLTNSQLNKSKHIFPNAKIVQTYACTEAGSSITFGVLYDPKISTTQSSLIEIYDMKKSNDNVERHIPNGLYAGYPPPHIELQIFKVDEGSKITIKERLGPYTVGVIGTRGPHVMTSYWWRGQDEPKESEIKQIHKSANPDGWFITNDMGYIDEHGALFFCGRLNEVIRTGGESVYAPEVENVLIQHPQVESCAVFALPHIRFGECVCAAIVLHTQDDQNTQLRSSEKMTMGVYESDLATRNNLRKFCRELGLGLGSPWKIFILKEIPTNSSGKVLKHELLRICMSVQREEKNKSSSFLSKL